MRNPEPSPPPSRQSPVRSRAGQDPLVELIAPHAGGVDARADRTKAAPAEPSRLKPP